MGQGQNGEPTQDTGRAAGATSTRKCNFKALKLRVDEKREKSAPKPKPEKISECTKKKLNLM